MADAEQRSLKAVVAVLVVLVVGLASYLAYQRYTERYVVTEADNGAAITRLITARFAGASSLKVASLSGTIQSSAAAVRAMGMLRSDQVIKVPFSVD